MKFSQSFSVEPSPDISDPPQLLVFIDANHERAQIVAVALRLSEPADDKLLFGDDFNLQPIAAALLFVSAAGVLGDDPLQTVLASRLQHFLAGRRKGR